MLLTCLELQSASFCKQKSAPLMLANNPKYSSFRIENFSRIAEDDREDSPLSASPNPEARLRSKEHKLNMWRTQKGMSVEDYNEVYELSDNYDELEVFDGFAANLEKAISERNVEDIRNPIRIKHVNINVRRPLTRHFTENASEEVSVFDKSQDEIIEDYSDDLHQDQASSNEIHDDEIDSEKESQEASDESPSYGKCNINQNGTTNMVSSVVDFDTVNGKVSI